ncbi:uncharacterized protein LOC104584965 [Brachypodium distachyon]|uniref:uncharacterized protein LOC104584965 n=1 Tax=Brachypodium distachyon TaxID=15368 RepID=UPI00052FF26E|nr:uncharacterized protein LOC104584965 [Brachypodium distachyon]|eukprot:XP_010239125.1 uncharacterized protein LOC104584965 [Brachypodium distachyon]
MSQPEPEPWLEEDDDMHDNNVGDLEAYCEQEDMDREIPFNRVFASNSDEDGPEEEVDEDGLTAKEANAFKVANGRDPSIPFFHDVSLADQAVVDGGEGFVLGPRPSSHRAVTQRRYGIKAGLRFRTLLEFKMWIKEFSVKHHRPYKVVHSNNKIRYTVKCTEDRCPWIVRARPCKLGSEWYIVSCCATHLCDGKNIYEPMVKNDHRQLTSEFIAYRLSNSIKSLPIMPIKSVMELVYTLFHYRVKYGKVWKAKQAAFKMLYGDWEEAYNRLPRLLGAMAHTNPGMVHVVEPFGQRKRTYKGATVRIFGRAFWAFERCIQAFQHCRPVISVDGTFLTGQFKGTMLVAISCDANSRLLPLAFSLVLAENNDNWAWFMGLLRSKVILPQREVCVISDRHQGILNAVEVDIPGHARLHHRWCMRHFCANFFRACRNKELTDLLQESCKAYSDRRFSNLINALLASRDLSEGGMNS